MINFITSEGAWSLQQHRRGLQKLELVRNYLVQLKIFPARLMRRTALNRPPTLSSFFTSSSLAARATYSDSSSDPPCQCCDGKGERRSPSSSVMRQSCAGSAIGCTMRSYERIGQTTTLPVGPATDSLRLQLRRPVLGRCAPETVLCHG